ncbi:unnamed protein product [Boreogadus saida]
MARKKIQECDAIREQPQRAGDGGGPGEALSSVREERTNLAQTTSQDAFATESCAFRLARSHAVTSDAVSSSYVSTTCTTRLRSQIREF